MLKSLLFFLFLIATVLPALAQEPIHEQTIKITSSYKPKLLSPAKINFSASPMQIDTTKPMLNYNIPAQNLSFSYKPVTGNADSISIKSEPELGNQNYVKAGYGTSKTPYLKGVFDLGDGKKHLSKIYGEYTSGKGKIRHQQFSDLNIRTDESYFVKNHEIYETSGFRSQKHYAYGYDHETFDFDKDDVLRKLNIIDIGVGGRNLLQNDLGINYNPFIHFYHAKRRKTFREGTFDIKLPVEKVIDENMKAGIELRGTFNTFKNKLDDTRMKNNLFEVNPAFTYHDEQFNIHIGIIPAFNNGQSSLLPDFYGEMQVPESPIVALAGWRGRFDGNTFRNFYNENPYIQVPDTILNTKKSEAYGGIRLSFSEHFILNAKIAYGTWKDAPLYLNNTLSPHEFLVMNESKMNVLTFHGDLNFIQSDKFSVTAGFEATSYTGLKDNDEAWGLYPFKISGSARWHVLDELLLKADLDAFSGAEAIKPGGDVKELNGGADLSIGAEYNINKMFSAWFDINNLFNNKYEFWNNYPVFGLQVIGGIKVRF